MCYNHFRDFQQIFKKEEVYSMKEVVVLILRMC